MLTILWASLVLLANKAIADEIPVNGVTVTYFADAELTQPLISRVVPEFETLDPGVLAEAGVSSDLVNVQWTAYTKVPEAGPYTFEVLAGGACEFKASFREYAGGMAAFKSDGIRVSTPTFNMVDSPCRIMLTCKNTAVDAPVMIRWTKKGTVNQARIPAEAWFVNENDAASAVISVPEHHKDEGIKITEYLGHNFRRKRSSSVCKSLEQFWQDTVNMSSKWQGWLIPPVLGEYQFRVVCVGPIQLELNKDVVAEGLAPAEVQELTFSHTVDEIGQPLSLNISHVRQADSVSVVQVRWKLPDSDRFDVIPISALRFKPQ